MPQTMTAADAAVDHILRRTIDDRQFSWHMMGTELLALCIKAHAERLGISETEASEQIDAAYHKRNALLKSQGASIQSAEELAARRERKAKNAIQEGELRYHEEQGFRRAIEQVLALLAEKRSAGTISNELYRELDREISRWSV